MDQISQISFFAKFFYKRNDFFAKCFIKTKLLFFEKVLYWASLVSRVDVVILGWDPMLRNDALGRFELTHSNINIHSPK